MTSDPNNPAARPAIRVLLVDDQTLVRQGVRSLLALAEGIEVIAEASDGRQAVELIPQIRPDVVVVMNPIYVEDIVRDLADRGLRPEISALS